MGRKIRRVLVQIVFGIVFLLILFFNRPSSNTDAISWSTVRYKSSASSPPAPSGGCPGLSSTSKPALVVSRVSADGEPFWLSSLADKYHICIYNADLSSEEHPMHSGEQWRLGVPANRGHEAMGYLTFLIDNYDSIPSAGAVFVHGSRFSWHNDDPDYDNLSLLSTLNVSAAVTPHGYHNLRCDWSAGTCPPSVSSQASIETAVQAKLAPWDVRAVSDHALPGALKTIFGENGSKWRLGPENAVRSQCCAQFVVSKDSMLSHSRQEYTALRQWLLDGMSSVRQKHAAPSDDRVAGRILSYVWQILFIQHSVSSGTDSLPDKNGVVGLALLNKMACPRADECYCRLYGRCNLEGCRSPNSCHGQYKLPKNCKLPDNWAITHS